MNGSRPQVLAVVPGLFPSTVLGVAKPLLRLHLQERITLDLKLPFLVNRRSVERADVIVICRVLSAAFARILQWARAAGTPLIYELDDNLVDVPEDIPGLEYARDPEVRRLLIDSLRAAGVVRVYAPSLRERLAEYSDRVQLVTGPLEWTMIPDHLPPKAGNRVRLVYATSRAQDRIGELLVSPLRRALDAFPRTELTIWGPKIDGLSDHPRVRHLAHIAEYDTYLSRFVAEAFDIGLAPLPDDGFHRCKSNNKFREFAASGVAGLYSDMVVYNSWITHGDTGWLVPDGSDAWFAALEHAIGHADERARVATNARQFAREHFNELITDREWMAAVDLLVAQPRTPGATAHGGSSPAAESQGWMSRVGRIGLGAARMIQRDGFRRTALRTKALVSSTVDLAGWELQRRRLERRVALAKLRLEPPSKSPSRTRHQ
jgi:glycosyltransferase involved in cell wall biosynthesis